MSSEKVVFLIIFIKIYNFILKIQLQFYFCFNVLFICYCIFVLQNFVILINYYILFVVLF